MSFPIKRIPFSGSRNPNFAVMTPESLKQNLTDIGLTCPLADEAHLQGYINETIKKMPAGAAQTFFVSNSQEYFQQQYGRLVSDTNDVDTQSQWTPSSSAFEYTSTLAVILHKEHFDYLKANYPDFTGNSDLGEKYDGKYSSVKGIEDLFVKNAVAVSSVVVNGVEQDALSSIFANVIKPLEDADVKDYQSKDDRLIYLLENYDPTKDQVDGIGGVLVNWNLLIKDYKVKKEDLKHETNLKVSARGVEYGNIADLRRDYQRVMAHFGFNAQQFHRAMTTHTANSGYTSYMNFTSIPIKKQCIVYDYKPPATEETFRHGVPLISKGDIVSVIVLYGADYIPIGSIDNTTSNATTTYSVANTQGFTFSTTQKLSAALKLDANAFIAKAELTLGIEVSFTESWNSSTTEQSSFSVPGGSKAFIYKGVLRTVILNFDPAKMTYSFGEDVLSNTNNLLATGTPLTQ